MENLHPDLPHPQVYALDARQNQIFPTVLALHD